MRLSNIDMIYSLNAALDNGKLDVMMYSIRERTPTIVTAMANYLRLCTAVACLSKIIPYSEHLKTHQREVLHILDIDESFGFMLSALLSDLAEDMNLAQKEETLLQHKVLIDKLQHYWNGIIEFT